MTATPLHPYFAPNGWAITNLTAVGQTFCAVIERPSTQTAIHAAGPSPDAAIAEAWRMAEIIEAGAE